VGLASVEDHPLDGVDLTPLIEDRMTARPRPIGFQSGNMKSWHEGQYKLVIPGKNKPAELYDLAADRAEQHDLADTHPELVERMRKDLEAWVASCKASDAGGDYQ